MVLVGQAKTCEEVLNDRDFLDFLRIQLVPEKSHAEVSFECSVDKRRQRSIKISVEVSGNPQDVNSILQRVASKHRACTEDQCPLLSIPVASSDGSSTLLDLQISSIERSNGGEAQIEGNKDTGGEGIQSNDQAQIVASLPSTNATGCIDLSWCPEFSTECNLPFVASGCPSMCRSDGCEAAESKIAEGSSNGSVILVAIIVSMAVLLVGAAVGYARWKGRKGDDLSGQVHDFRPATVQTRQLPPASISLESFGQKEDAPGEYKDLEWDNDYSGVPSYPHEAHIEPHFVIERGLSSV